MGIQNEIWHTVPKFPNYEISETKLFRHKKTLRVKKFYLDDSGYLRTNVNYLGKKHKPGQHQLIGWTFVPNPFNKPELHHIDEDKLNNNKENLMWVTKEEHRAISKANEQTCHKIKRDDVVFIRDNYEMLGERFLSKRFKVSKNTIYNIATGRAREDVVGGIIHPLKGVRKKITNLQTGEIIPSADDLAIILGISRKEVHRRLNGERYNKTPFRYVGKEDVCKIMPEKIIEPSPIAVFDLEWNLIKRFQFKVEAAKFTDTDVSRINEFLRGYCSFIKGYKFKEIDYNGNFIEPTHFVSKKPPLKPKKIKQAVTPSKPLIQYDMQGNEKERFHSIGHLARVLKVDKKNLRTAINRNSKNQYKGFIYKYA